MTLTSDQVDFYNKCDSSPKKISCFCGGVSFMMFNGRPRRVLECCCVDCFQHLEWASANGGPLTPIIPKLSYWDNDLIVERGEDLLQVVILREKGRSQRLISNCCFSTLMVDHPFYNKVMFMLFEEACMIQMEEFEKSHYETRPAESRIYVKDFESSRGVMPKFVGDQSRIHQTCCPPYLENWNRKTSKYLDNPKGESCQSIFGRIPTKILGLKEGERILSFNDI